uniref:Uncharacterized protein n=1 Tax=Sphaerodactylus townsendi TaxID=933632 RepID=A0ACB8G0A6_9SAUR
MRADEKDKDVESSCTEYFLIFPLRLLSNSPTKKNGKPEAAISACLDQENLSNYCPLVTIQRNFGFFGSCVHTLLIPRRQGSSNLYCQEKNEERKFDLCLVLQSNCNAGQKFTGTN